MGFRKFIKNREEEDEVKSAKKTAIGSIAAANADNKANAQMESILARFNADIGNIGTVAADIGKAEAVQGSIATVASAGDVAKTAQSAKETVEAGKAATDVASGGVDPKTKLALAAADKGLDLLGVDKSTTEGGALSGAAQGASMGASFGPWGAVIGGAIGGIAGGLGASAAQKDAEKAAKARAAAQHHGNLARIEEDKDRKIQGALESMKSAFSRNLQNNRSVKL